MPFSQLFQSKNLSFYLYFIFFAPANNSSHTSLHKLLTAINS